MNCPDRDLPHLRPMLVENAAGVQAEYPGPVELLAHWPAPPDADRRLLIVRLRSEDDVSQLARLDATYPGWPVLALVEGDYDAAALLRVNRAGACQILPAAFSRPDLEAALDRVLVQFAVPRTPSRVVAVTGAVEGCGATSVAISLASELAAAQVPTVLAELSPGAGRLAGYLNLSPATTVRDLLAGDGPTIASVQAALLLQNACLSVLAGPTRAVAPQTPPAEKVRQLIHLLRHLGAVVVLDLAATYDVGHFEGLAGADQIVVVGRQDVPAVQAAKALVEGLAERGLPRPALVLNGYSTDRVEFEAGRLKELVGVPAVYTVADDRDGFRRAADAGRPLRDVASHSPALHDLRTFSQAVLAAAGLPAHLIAPAGSSWVRRLIDRMAGH